MGVLSAAAGVVVGLFGALLVFGAAVGLKRAVDFRRLSVVPGRAVSDGQLVGLSGVVIDAGGLESPLTGTRSVAYKWTMEALRGGTNSARTWDTKTVEGAVEPFHVETDDGTTVAVEPPDDVSPQANLEFDCERVYRVEPNEDPPERVQRLVDDGVIEANDGSLEDDLDMEFDDRGPLGTRQYSEYALAEGDDVWLYGRAAVLGSGLRLTKGSLFVVSDSDVAELQRENVGRTVLLFLAGLLALLFAYGLLT